MTDYTIITTKNEIRTQADRYTRDHEGDLYCYRNDEPVTHVPEEHFVAIFETEHGNTTTNP